MEVDRFSEEPPYRQVARFLREQIRAGEITGRLPSGKDLQDQYGIAEFTAMKVLRLLRSEGWARMAFGTGTFVAPREDWPEAD